MCAHSDHRRTKPREHRGRLAAAGWAGLVLPVLFSLFVGVESLLRPGYNQISDQVSYLGWGPHAILQNLNFLITGSLAVVLGLGLGVLQVPGSAKRFVRGGNFVVVFGVASILAGLSLIAVNVLPPGVGFRLHTAAAFLAFSVVLAAEFSIARALTNVRDTAWRAYGRLSLTTGVSGVVLLGTFVATLFGPIGGLTERLLIGACFVWIEVTGMRLRTAAAASSGETLRVDGAPSA